MSSMAENYIRYGLDPVESTPIHIAYDVTLWLFQDWSSVVEYHNSGQMIVQESFHNEIVPVDETAPRSSYAIH